MGQRITIRDKEFLVYLNEGEIAGAVADIAKRINKEMEGEFPVFLPVLNGSFMFAADLLKKVTIPSELSFVKVASYDGKESTGKVSELIGLTENLKDRNIVVLEDIVDSGLTIDKIVSVLKKKEVRNIKVATLLFKPDAYKGSAKIDYIGFRIPNNFVVGYGMDYLGQGRNLREIHILA